MEAAIIALVAGVAGVVAGGLLQIRGTRLQQLRERRIAGADEFARVATEVFVSLRARMETLGSPIGREAEWLAGFKEAVDASTTDVHEVTRRLARIELLFGPGSATASRATQTGAHLLQLIEEVTKEPPDIDAVTREWDTAADRFGEFNRLAHALLTRSAWRIWWAWSADPFLRKYGVLKPRPPSEELPPSEP